ncbi:MAG: arginase family protein [Synechococcaceae cyanobacterium]|nr:arginase family protein [Synechococcaceae cyanobacterium]
MSMPFAPEGQPSTPPAAPLEEARATPPLAEELASLFALFDANGDGVITPAEVEQVLIALAAIIAPAEADALRRLMCSHGAVSRAAFLDWARQQPGLGSHQLLRDLFQLIDTDGNGWLSRDELAVMLSLLLPEAAPESPQALLERLDGNGDGRISVDEFLALLEQQNGLRSSLADLKRLKKTLVQISSTARLAGVGLVEVDCDLGAGKPGAGAGIDLLKNAVQRQRDLRRISERLIAEIQGQQRPTARAEATGISNATPHARHIETIAAVMADAAGLVAATIEQGRFPIVLAGDHSTAAATIAGLRRAHPGQRLGVIWIDAHADIHSPFTTPSGNMHGMPLAIAASHDNLPEAINAPDPRTRTLWRELQRLHGSEDASIGLQDLIYIAVRDTEAAEDVTIAAHAIPVISTEQVRRHGPVEAAQRCLTHLAGVDRIYVSFDVDALDSTICKGTGTPVPGGLWAHEADAILRTLLADPRVCCWEICEINPHLDELNTLAEVSLGIFRAGLEVLAERLSPAEVSHGG